MSEEAEVVINQLGEQLNLAQYKLGQARETVALLQADLALARGQAGAAASERDRLRQFAERMRHYAAARCEASVFRVGVADHRFDGGVRFVWEAPHVG